MTLRKIFLRSLFFFACHETKIVFHSTMTRQKSEHEKKIFFIYFCLEFSMYDCAIKRQIGTRRQRAVVGKIHVTLLGSLFSNLFFFVPIFYPLKNVFFFFSRSSTSANGFDNFLLFTQTKIGPSIVLLLCKLLRESWNRGKNSRQLSNYLWNEKQAAFFRVATEVAKMSETGKSTIYCELLFTLLVN